MDGFLQRLFRDEVELQCRFVVLAVDQLKAASSKTEAWFALQGAVISAANLSKLLWGSRGRSHAERQDLRDSLDVDDSSILRDPDLRNDFEHFDERIDLMFGEGRSSSIYAGRNIGRDIDLLLPEGTKHFGRYDSESGVIAFWDHTFSLPDIVAEARRILAVIESGGARPATEGA